VSASRIVSSRPEVEAGRRGPFHGGELGAELRPPTLFALHGGDERREGPAGGDRSHEPGELGLELGERLTDSVRATGSRLDVGLREVERLRQGRLEHLDAKRSRSTAASTRRSAATRGTSRLFGQMARSRVW
jgi:hypothetical protein